jgi:hypothetical protein
MRFWLLTIARLGRSRCDTEYNSTVKKKVSVRILYFDVADEITIIINDDIIRKKPKRSISETNPDRILM